MYTVGFSCDDDENEMIHRVARVANALEAGADLNSYRNGQAPKKNVEATQGTNLGKRLGQFFVGRPRSTKRWNRILPSLETDVQRESGTLMIHYSDQYDSSSPNYDVITSTNKREPYLLSLRQALSEANLSQQLDPEVVLSALVSVDGELALKLQRAKDTELVEFVGFVGGLALSRALLERSAPDHVWIPISLNELAQHDRSYRSGDSGLFQFDSRGKASDDLCFVGVPKNPADSTLKLWLVETKGGNAHIKTGREQIDGALENLKEWLLPSTTYADDQLLYSEFGKIILDVARRMFNYDVLDGNEFENLETRERDLLEGAFDVSFITDEQGHIGEVIRVKRDTFQSDINANGHVRAIEAPLKTLEILSGTPVEEALPDLSLNSLSFDLPTVPAFEFGNETDDLVDADDGIEVASDDPEVATEAEPVDSEQSQPTASTQRSVTDDGDSSTERRHTISSESGETELEGAREPHTDETDSTGTDTGSPQGQQGTDQPRDESEHTDIDELQPSDGEEPGRFESTGERNQPTETDSLATQINRTIDQLEESPEPDTQLDPGKLVSNLKRAFDSLDVAVHPPNPSSVSIGPRKVGVDVLPKEGQKVEGILRNLDTLSVQIQAQGDIVGTRVPSKGAVRLEIPHGDPRDIYLREGLEALRDDLDEPLVVPIGVDTENNHHALSFVDERHALIGGATGSGKSNFLSSVVSSLAITHNPQDLKLSILDPKGVDFGRFASLPHVQQGGYYDTPETCTTHLLEIVREEVPQRREYLSQAGVSSLAQLYEYADELDMEPLPFHVVVIDEYADLIMSVDDEDAFEEAVTRLAQIGRALGIVILLATQRPSADIVSGKIKANFPCRISFRLPSNTDSRVILDEPGAEDLQGAGDMIVHSQSGERYNLQGYYLTPIDAKKVIELLSTGE